MVSRTVLPVPVLLALAVLHVLNRAVGAPFSKAYSVHLPLSRQDHLPISLQVTARVRPGGQDLAAMSVKQPVLVNRAIRPS